MSKDLVSISGHAISDQGTSRCDFTDNSSTLSTSSGMPSSAKVPRLADANWGTTELLLNGVRSGLQAIRVFWHKVHFWYFTDVDALGHRAIGSMDPSRIPNALNGHQWSFLAVVLLTAATLPYATQVPPIA